MKATISLKDIPENTLSSSVVKASYTLVRARLASSQTLDEHESAFSLPLFAMCCFFERGVIFSIEVAVDATLVASGMEAMGVMGVPFLTTHTTLFLRFERGSVFLSWHTFLN